MSAFELGDIAGSHLSLLGPLPVLRRLAKALGMPVTELLK